MTDTTRSTEVKPGDPSVRFAERGDVTAAEAVGVEALGDGTHLVYILHPNGGRVQVAWPRGRDIADSLAVDIQGALTAWAELGR